MNETEAKEFADKILAMVFDRGQWCKVEYVYRGKVLHQVLIKEISIKITK